MLAALLFACQADPSGDTVAPPPTEPPPGEALSGELTYRSEVDGVVRCDLDVSLRGEPSSRECQGCSWVYDVLGTVTGDRSSAECRASPVVTFVPGSAYRRLGLAAAPTFEVDWVDPPVDLTDVLLSGYDYDGGDYQLADQWEPLSWTGDPNGSWSQAGDLHWTRSGSWEVQEFLLDGFETCEDFTWSSTTAAAVGPAVVEDLPCQTSALDVWTFSGTEGQVVALSVDTVAVDSAFSPFFYLNGPDDCTFLDAIDNVPCAFPSTNLGRSCPAAEATLPSSGEYELRVGSDLGCTGTLAVYSLTTAGIAALTLRDDDRPALTEVITHWTESAELNATFAE